VRFPAILGFDMPAGGVGAFQIVPQRVPGSRTVAGTGGAKYGEDWRITGGYGAAMVRVLCVNMGRESISGPTMS